jgi:hypothetical protein
MAYEVFKRTGVRVEQPTLSLTPDGRIALNAAATRVLIEAQVKTVLLLWDKKNSKVAIKAAPKGDKNAYAVSLVSDKRAGSLRAKTFLSYVGWSAPRREALPATWNENEKMLEITLPQEFLTSGSRGDQGPKAKQKQRRR